MKDILPDSPDYSGHDMECAIWGKWHMHLYFSRQDGRRIGSRFYHNNSPSSGPDKTLYRVGMLWSEGPMRNCVTLQEFVTATMTE